MATGLADGNGVNNRLTRVHVEPAPFYSTKKELCKPSKYDDDWL